MGVQLTHAKLREITNVWTAWIVILELNVSYTGDLFHQLIAEYEARSFFQLSLAT